MTKYYKEDNSGIYALCILGGALFGAFLFWTGLIIDSAVGVYPNTLDNVCKVIAGNDTKFLKVNLVEDKNNGLNKQVIICTKISPQKTFDDGSIILK